MLILGILLAVSLAGNGILAKLYVKAKADTARVQQAYDSFAAQVKVQGEEAQKKAVATKTADEKRKKDADTENASAVARLNADISRVRRERDARAAGRGLPAAPPGSKCPDGQACFDAAGLESALRDHIAEIRGLADKAAEIEVDLNTAKKWATGHE